MPVVESAQSTKRSEMSASRSRSASTARREPRVSESESDMPMTFASFYYSLKVSRGKGYPYRFKNSCLTQITKLLNLIYRFF